MKARLGLLLALACGSALAGPPLKGPAASGPPPKGTAPRSIVYALKGGWGTDLRISPEGLKTIWKEAGAVPAKASRARATEEVWATVDGKKVIRPFSSFGDPAKGDPVIGRRSQMILFGAALQLAKRLAALQWDRIEAYPASARSPRLINVQSKSELKKVLSDLRSLPLAALDPSPRADLFRITFVPVMPLDSVKTPRSWPVLLPFSHSSRVRCGGALRRLLERARALSSAPLHSAPTKKPNEPPAPRRKG